MADATRDRTVGELMTTDVLTTSITDTVAEASDKMLQRGVGSVVVVEGDNRPRESSPSGTWCGWRRPGPTWPRPRFRTG